MGTYHHQKKKHKNQVIHSLPLLKKSHRAVDTIMGQMATRTIIPLTIGSNTYNSIKDDVVQEMLEVFPRYANQFTEYADRVFDLEVLLSGRLAGLPPDEFEGMLH